MISTSVEFGAAVGRARKALGFCRVLRALPAAADEVAGVGAGGERLQRLVAAIAERAELVGAHAAVEGPAEPDPDPAPTDSHYDG